MRIEDHIRSRSGRPRPRFWRWLGFASIPGLGGCDPIFDVGGAFFPSWIAAAIVGLVATGLVRELLVRTRIDERLFGRGLAYIGLFTCISILTWIWFFRT